MSKPETAGMATSRPGSAARRPAGGDGGDGGSIIVVADVHLASLLDFKYKRHYTAERRRGRPEQGPVRRRRRGSRDQGADRHGDLRGRRRRAPRGPRRERRPLRRREGRDRRQGQHPLQDPVEPGAAHRRARAPPARPGRCASSSSCSPTSACSATPTSASRRSSAPCRGRVPRSRTTRSRPWSPTSASSRCSDERHVRDRGHPRPDRGRLRRRRPRPPVPAPRRALPGAAPHRRGHVHDRA